MKAAVVMVLVGVIVVVGLAQPNPTILWTLRYGTDRGEAVYCACQASEGGYVIGGTTHVAYGNKDVYLVRVNEDGDTLWTRTYGGDESDVANGICETRDGGFAVVGYTTSFGANVFDVYLLRLDSYGDSLWTRVYEICGYDVAEDVQQTVDGGFVVTGRTSGIMADIFMMKVSSVGDTLWSRQYGTIADYEKAVVIRQTSDNGYVLMGGVEYAPTCYGDFFLVKTDSCGDTLWTRTYGTERSEFARCGQVTADGGYILAGYDADPYSPPYYPVHFYLVRTDASGDMQWTRTYDFGYHDEQVYDIGQTSDGGYIVTGQRDYDFFLFRVNAWGDTLWSRSYDGGELESVQFVQITSDHGYVMAGTIQPPGSSSGDFWLVRTGSDTMIVNIPKENVTCHPIQYVLYYPYPNPFNSEATISYEVPVGGRVQILVYDVLGRQVGILVDGRVDAGRHQVVWDASGMTSGVYFVRMKAGEFVRTRKVVFLK